MIVLNKKLLKLYRGCGRCEACGAWCKSREAAHLWSRGAGRLDIPVNLISLGAALGGSCGCHGSSHYSGIPSHDFLLGIVSEREGVEVDLIERAIHLLRRTPKETDVGDDPQEWAIEQARAELEAVK